MVCLRLVENGLKPGGRGATAEGARNFLIVDLQLAALDGVRVLRTKADSFAGQVRKLQSHMKACVLHKKIFLQISLCLVVSINPADREPPQEIGKVLCMPVEHVDPSSHNGVLESGSIGVSLCEHTGLHDPCRIAHAGSYLA